MLILPLGLTRSQSQADGSGARPHAGRRLQRRQNDVEIVRQDVAQCRGGPINSGGHKHATFSTVMRLDCDEKNLPFSFSCLPRLRKFHDSSTGERTKSNKQSIEDHINMVTAFAGMVPCSCPRNPAQRTGPVPEKSEIGSGSLDFQEALVCGNSCAEGAKQILRSGVRETRRICQWCHLLDKTSLQYWTAEA